jgi:hypothetical protein
MRSLAAPPRWRRARVARPFFDLDGGPLVATLPERILFYIENTDACGVTQLMEDA